MDIVAKHGAWPRLIPLAAAIALSCNDGAYAATIHVNDPSPGSVSGKCTLFDAVAALNASAVVNGCAAGNGNNDIIDLSFFSASTIIKFAVSGSADGKSALQVNKAATISAPLDVSGAPLVTLRRSTVSGTPDFRILATGADLTLQGLILQNGTTTDQGGAVFASGDANLTLRDTIVSDSMSTASSGGGVAAECGNLLLQHAFIGSNRAFNGGAGVYTSNSSGGNACPSTITLQNANVSGNIALHGACGGIYSFNGSVVADGSAIVANTSGVAIGGIGAYQSVTLTNSTVSDNSAAYAWGGISSATISLINTTITGNSSLDGAALGAKNLTIYFSTISGNVAGNATDGAIFFDTHAQLVGNIIRGNLPYDLLSSHTAISAGDHNIIASSMLSFQAPLPADTIDCDPLLGNLADNSGPTMTMALGAGSCAIDAGPVSPPGTISSDQRGAMFARKVGAATDIGAFEVQSNDRIFYDGFGGKPPFSFRNRR